MRNRHGRARAIATVLVLSFFTSGCGSMMIGTQYLPERTYYQMFETFEGAAVRHVKHVRETRWGVHWFGMRLKRPSVREVVDEALEGNPNYYVADLNIHTNAHATLLFVYVLGFLFIPKVTIEFDVLEVVVDGDVASMR